MNCIIIEDEPLAQIGLRNLIKNRDILTLVEIFDSISEFEYWRDNNLDITLDLVFLDIELPRQNGIEYLKKKNLTTPVIITSAYNRYAIDGYELNVIDYLLKPIADERFEKAINKVISLRSIESKKTDFMYVKLDKAFEKVLFSDILYVEAMRNYVVFHIINNKKLITYKSLKSVESALKEQGFVKVQKSFIVNIKQVSSVSKGIVMLHNKTEIKVSRENRAGIIKKVLNNSNNL